MIKEIKKNLTELGFNANEIKVYIALTLLGEAPAAQVAKKADLPRTTVISILNKLAEDNFLTLHRYRGVTYYWVESPHAIVASFQSKIKVAEELNSMLSELYRSETHFPHAQVYDTKSSIRAYMEKVISGLPRKSTICTIDTPRAGNYSKIFSDKVGDSILSLKKTRAIHTRTLLPHGSLAIVNPQKLLIQDIDLRELPPEIDFAASLWLVGDQLVHFSGNPPFIVAVKHPLIVASMRSIYEFLWQLSAKQ